MRDPITLHFTECDFALPNVLGINLSSVSCMVITRSGVLLQMDRQMWRGAKTPVGGRPRWIWLGRIYHDADVVAWCYTPKGIDPQREVVGNQWRELAEELAEHLLEKHQEEIDAEHFGDDADDCSYCRTLRAAGLNPHPAPVIPPHHMPGAKAWVQIATSVDDITTEHPCTVEYRTSADDRPYRVVVRLDNNRSLGPCAPECVIPSPTTTRPA